MIKMTVISNNITFQLFNVCMGFGVDFYAKANAALFLPGILILVLQSK